MAFLLDSNILIYAFKNMGAVRSRIAQHDESEILLCTPVIWELLSGALKSQSPQKQLSQLDAFQARFATLGFDLDSAKHAAKTRAYLEQCGTPIGPVDTMIAGIALAHKLTIVTRNTREFGRVPGLRMENWFD